MKKLTKFFQLLPAKARVCIHLTAVLLLLFLIYAFLGAPALSIEGTFRRAEKAAMVGPSAILGQIRPEEYPCDAIILGEDSSGVYLYVMHRWDPESSELIYREKDGPVTLLAAPGSTLYQYEFQARIPIILFDSCKEASQAELDLTVYAGSFEKTYHLAATREAEGYFAFDLLTRDVGLLGAEGEALRMLQEISSNSMAGNINVSFPAAVRFYDASGNLILEETTRIRSAAAQAIKWPGYSGTMDGYEYCHSAERDRKWEEDILYLAQICLDTHPYVSGTPVWVSSYSEPFGGKNTGFSNDIYRDETRKTFIGLVNEVIERIPEYTDIQLIYEAQRIVASLGDIHSSLSVDMADDTLFPILYEYITEDGTGSFYAVRVSPEYEDIYLGKLISINNVPVAEIVEKLTPYMPAENEYYPVRAMASGSLSAKNALHAVGIVDLDAESAEFTFETASGTVTRTIAVMTKNEFQQSEIIRHPMTTDAAVMRHQSGNYWYEVLENNTLYMRISSLSEAADYSFRKYLFNAAKVLSEAEEPMNLVIDFRNNHGGPEHLTQWNEFVENVRSCSTNGIYLLINEGCVSSGVAAPYQLKKCFENAILVGTPTAQFPNSPAGQYSYNLPNNGNAFYISSNYFAFAPEETDTALRPDIEIHQTGEDYQNNIDTVLDYVLSLSSAE